METLPCVWLFGQVAPRNNGSIAMIKGLKFAGIPTRDQAKAVAFWTDKVGFRVMTDQPLGAQRWIELAIGCYFALTIWYAWTNENYFTVPFLLLFVVGYWYTGLLSLLQGRFERWRSGANLDESSPKPYPVGV